MRLLLAALNFVNVGELMREQPQREGIGRRFDRLGKVLPEAWHGDGQELLAAIEADDRRRPQSGPLAPSPLSR